MPITKKCFSEKERATSNGTGDHCYGKKALSRNGLKAVQETIASVQPHSPDKKETGGRSTKMPLTLVAEV